MMHNLINFCLFRFHSSNIQLLTSKLIFFQVCDDVHRVEVIRERSKSLPIPDLQVTTPIQSPTTTPPLQPEEILPTVRRETRSVSECEPRKEPSFKRIKGRYNIYLIFVKVL